MGGVIDHVCFRVGLGIVSLKILTDRVIMFFYLLMEALFSLLLLGLLSLIHQAVNFGWRCQLMLRSIEDLLVLARFL